MPYSRTITSDLVIQNLYERREIYNLCNRGFDGLLHEQRGANKILVPSLPLLEAVTPPATNRKYMIGDTDMAEIVLQKSVVELGMEVEAKFTDKSGNLIIGFTDGMSKAHSKNFNARVIAEAQNNGTVINWEGATLSFSDFANIDAKFDQLEVDAEDRFVVYPARLKGQFYQDPDLARAVSYNPNFLRGGIVEILNLKLIPSARVGKLGGKENLVGIWGPGLAFVLDNMIDREEVYDKTNKRTDIDYLVWYGAKLLRPEWAIINKAN